MCEEAKFLDILEPRRTQSGILRFMSRAWYPKRTQILDKIYSPRDLKDVTVNSLYLEAVIEAESTRSNANKEELKKEIVKYIEEIGLDKKMHVVRWLGIFTLKVAFTMNVGIFVNEAAILKVKSTMGKNPLLFLPTHRSYADFCILTYLCYHYDIELPAVASGMDFYSMAVIGQVLRESCAFYIRRTLAGAPLYAATLQQYVRTLVSKHGAPVEFFLEGTRSRSNKSLPPKYGMLSMSLMPLFAREVSDITVVPVNISYDRLMEQTTFAYEHLGVPKPKESTRGLLKWITSLNDHFGNMYINFGEPMSVRDYLQHIPYSPEALKPLDLQNISPEQFKQVQDVAEYTVALQQQNTVVTISNLIAIVLMQSLMKMQPLSYDEVLSEVDWLKKFLRDLGATIFEDDVRRNVDKILTIHAKSWTLDKDKKLRLMSKEVIDVTDDLKRKMKGHVLKAETMVNAIPIIQLQIYVNPILHYLVPPALIYLIVRSRNVTTDELHKGYERLRKLLRHEFYHVEKGEQKRYNEALDYCIRNNVVTITDDTVTAGIEVKLQYLLQWAVWPALTTLKIAIDVVSQNVNIEHKQALKAIQEMGERGSRHPYSLSLDAAANCLSGLVLATALRRDKQEQNIFYSVVPDVMASCRDLVNSVIPTFSTDFTTSNPVIVNTGQRSSIPCVAASDKRMCRCAAPASWTYIRVFMIVYILYYITK